MNSRIYFGAQASAPPSEDKTVFEPIITLDSTQIASKQITLSQTPVSINDVFAVVVGASVLDNISLSGNTIDFSASSYASSLSVGDQVQFIYKRV